MFCTNCGAATSPTQEFCTTCGTALASTTPTANRELVEVPIDHSATDGFPAPGREPSTKLLITIGAGVLLLGLAVGALATSTGAGSFVIGPRYSQDQLDFEKAASRQDGFENGKKAGYNQGLSDGKTQGYSSGFDAGKSTGYDSGFQAGSAGGYESGYQSGKSDGYQEGKLAGYSDGRFDGYDDGYSSGKSEGYNNGYTFGCEAIFRLMGGSTFTYGGKTYYKSSFCS